MIEDKPIDYKTEYNKTINKLVSLRQKHDGLKEDHDYIKSLADRYFDERIKLKKENEQLKQKEMDFLEKRYEEVSYLKIKIEGLEKENEQLKQENKELRGDRDYWKTLAQSLARTNGRGDYID